MEFIMNDLVNDYVTLVTRVRDTGRRVKVRGQDTRELTAVTLIFPDILSPLLPIGVGRGVNTKLAAVEALQLISGNYYHDLVVAAAPTFEDVLVDLEDPKYGAYGPRTVEQVANCVAILRADPLTRQAVVSIWNENDLTHVGDKPCTVFLQFMVRPDAGTMMALELHVHMRSQDVWLGTPYDVFMFTQLQHTVAHDLGLPVGRYVHHTTSLHIYERNVAATLKLEQNTDYAHTRTAELPLGVIAVPNPDDPESDEPYDVAAYLAEGTANDQEITRNPWYSRQLDKIDDGGRFSAPAPREDSLNVINSVTGSVTGPVIQVGHVAGEVTLGGDA